MVQTLLQDVLYVAVRSGSVIQGSGAGRLQSSFAITTLELKQTLNSSQVVEDAVGKEIVDQFQAAFSDFFSLSQAPLRITHQVSRGFRR